MKESHLERFLNVANLNDLLLITDAIENLRKRANFNFERNDKVVSEGEKELQKMEELSNHSSSSNSNPQQSPSSSNQHILSIPRKNSNSSSNTGSYSGSSSPTPTTPNVTPRVSKKEKEESDSNGKKSKNYDSSTSKDSSTNNTPSILLREVLETSSYDWNELTQLESYIRRRRSKSR